MKNIITIKTLFLLGVIIAVFVIYRGYLDQSSKVNFNVQEANAYISANYPGYTIVKITEDPMCSGDQAFDLTVQNASKQQLTLIFMPDGKFAQREVDVPITEIPQNVKVGIDSQFQNSVPANHAERLILPDSKIQYLVDIQIGSQAREVIFDSEGTLICQSK